MADFSVIDRAARVVPSPRQLAWQELEFYGFVHFGINTFTGQEWGTGSENPALFNPAKLDCRQWAKVFKAAGMRGMILTAKHHDGFCLWPSKATAHTVAASPWQDGRGDVVKEAAAACAAYGLKFGVYLSPWDRHEATYGAGPAYDEFYKRQLRELLTNYGELFCVWLDGACGEGKNGRKQEYDWQGYYDLIRKLQPNAVISITGPDVRWVGNEAGVCRSSEWSVVPDQIEDLTFWDLGSRKALMKAKDSELVWHPAEVDMSIRDGWFYHEKEDFSVKPLAKLREVYYKSVGANAALLLNVPPNQDGLFAERDVETLISLGAQLKIDFKENLAEGSAVRDTLHLNAEHTGQMALDPSPDTYWHSGPMEKGVKAALVLDLGDDYDIDKIVLKEHIATGQQIEKFSVFADRNCGEESPKSQWKKIAVGTVVGHKRVVRFAEMRVRRIKVVIELTRGFATMESFEAY